MKNKLGKQTFQFPLKPRIIGSCSIVGEKEGKGPMAKWFDIILEDDTFGEKTWKKSESKMLKQALLLALQRSGLEKDQIDSMLTGDLINQLMPSSFMARDLSIPFLGIYGACSIRSYVYSLVLVAQLELISQIQFLNHYYSCTNSRS